MHRCPACGAESSLKALFCRSCGLSLQENGASEAAVSEVTPSQASLEASMAASPGEPSVPDAFVDVHRKMGNSTNALWGSLAVAGMVAIGTLGWLMGRQTPAVPLEPTATPMTSPLVEAGNLPPEPGPTSGPTATPVPSPITSESTTSLPALKTYESRDLGFKIEYPSDWRVEVQARPANYTRVRFDSATANVGMLVDVGPPAGGQPVDAWWDLDSRLRKTHGSRYRMLQINPMTLDGESAARWMFTLKKKGAPELKKIDWGAVHNGKGYGLLFSAPTSEFDRVYPTFSQSLLTFKFLD